MLKKGLVTGEAVGGKAGGVNEDKSTVFVRVCASHTFYASVFSHLGEFSHFLVYVL